MKSLQSFLYLICLSTVFLGSCLTDECTEEREFFRYDPVFYTLNEIRVPIQVYTETRTLENPGRMYYYKDHLFINEQGKGIFIYDNRDAKNPSFVAFYEIRGNFDISIKNDLLYADNVIDLLTIDISDLKNPVLVHRLENYKSKTIRPNSQTQRFYAYSVRSPQKQVLDCSDGNFRSNSFERNGSWFTTDFLSSDVTNTKSGSSGNSGAQGVAGSTARFTIVNDYLYTVDHSRLISLNIANIEPELVAQNNMGWGIETIYPVKDKLFIGSTTGMYIFSIENPASPSQLSKFEHASSCDPVVVRGDLAYVTLRSGRACQGFTNQLDVIDISNLNSPSLIKSYPMINPNGMTFRGEELFLSEGKSGIKVLDIRDSKNVKRIAWNKSIASTDLIYLGENHLLSIGENGFYQYDVSDINNMIELSRIEINK